MLNNKNQNNQDKLTRRLMYAIISLVVTMCILAIVLIPGARMYLKWPYHYVQCGMRAPILLMHGSDRTMYILPEDYGFRSIGFYDGFLCSHQEAIDNNYRQFGN